MQWNSLSEFVAMGGAGVYVWPAFGATAVCLVWEVLALWRRRAAGPRPAGRVQQPEGVSR